MKGYGDYHPSFFQMPATKGWVLQIPGILCVF